MKPTNRNSSRPKNEDSLQNDPSVAAWASDELKKIVENNRNVINNNNEIIKNSLQLAASNDSIAETIEILAATNEIIARTNEKILNSKDSDDSLYDDSQTANEVGVQRKEWENHYSVLTEATRNNPVMVLTQFTRITSVFKQRQDLNTLYWGAMQSEMFEYQDGGTKADWVSFYNSLIELMEATYRIAEMIKKKELMFNYLDIGNSVVGFGGNR